MIKQKNIFIAAVGQEKTAGDFSQVLEAQLFIKADGRGIGGDDGVELQQAEPAVPGGDKAVPDQCFPYMVPPAVAFYGVGGVGDMTAAA